MSSIDRELKHNKYPYLIMSSTGFEFSQSEMPLQQGPRDLRDKAKGTNRKLLLH
ncbi:hypothetical protein DPMN_104449 [Dreissena polymorpha]|uniref:Uncharacterized protein n=1 Tax=Dreissena polymorpha TaxID=45954 RepID=A0A9D4K2R7_DREPO|nr:hypothetical protein DPMN_104449 [Dreissena polymorpha]